MTKPEELFLWTEKYAPQNIDDIILDETTKLRLKSMIEDGNIPNMLFVSKNPGLGKSTLAKVLVKELNADVKWINASLESGIDMLRVTIQHYVTAASFNNKKKIVILDEADYLNPTSTQPAFRGLLDEFSKHCTFIFTCNYSDKIIEPLRNRLYTIDFDNMYINKRKELIVHIVNKIKEILKNEQIEYNEDNIINFIVDLYPSIRKMIIELQNLTRNGEFLYTKNNAIDNIYDKLSIVLEKKQGRNIYKVVKSITHTTGYYQYIYDNFNKFYEIYGNQIFILAGHYLYKEAFVTDKNLNLLAFCFECLKILENRNK